VLELIALDEFPGAERFIGLGQLPSEALRLLWPSRKPVTSAQLALGNDAWNALASDDPRHLAALARSGTPALPIMAPALHRHLRELPSAENGLRLTERLILQIVSEGSTAKPMRVWADVYPLLMKREPIPLQLLVITELGRAVLRGERDWLSLQPPSRWVGGVYIQPRVAGWRWDEVKRDAAFR
jgi:hypothetical protein